MTTHAKLLYNKWLSNSTPEFALAYAKITNTRNKLVEQDILRNIATTYDYIRSVIRAPWPEGEEIIKNDGTYSYRYANLILKGRFKKGEPSISETQLAPVYFKKYLLPHIHTINEDTVNLFENVIKTYIETQTI